MASGAMLLNFRLTLHAVFLCPVHLFNAELRIGESRQPWVSRQSDMTAAAQGREDGVVEATSADGRQGIAGRGVTPGGTVKARRVTGSLAVAGQVHSA
jgi:hypothetical protein